MRVAVIADIHGNAVALEAVLADSAEAGAEQIVCLGDVAATGPQPREVVERLRALGCPVVMGNADAWLLSPDLHADADEATRRIEEIDRWCAGQLTPEDLDYVRTFQPSVTLSLGAAAAMLCFHGSPRSYNEILLATTPDDEVERILAGTHAAVLAGGHTHAQMLRRYRDLLLLNPGSVGLPMDRLPPAEPIRNPPRAEYALVSLERGHQRIELRLVPFDVAALLRAARASGMPHAEWWAAEWASG
ncbi:MAG: metallophosphoesterase family protein [Ktedonobacterales bacterium]|nr:metallophosphoesterase family protein [Ktedonobacterales bacterium]